jgi:solute carrier family 15 (peptide/histidine transporter), member 3/4
MLLKNTLVEPTVSDKLEKLTIRGYILCMVGVVGQSSQDLSCCQASFSMAVTCQPGTLHDETARLLPLPSPLQTQAVPPLSTNDTNSKGSILTHVCLPILVLEFSLWVALATLTGTLPIYLRKHLGIDSVRATEINYAFHTLGNLAPIGGGYLADQHLGRVPTILLACGMLTTGLTFCMIAAHPSVASVELLMVGLFGGVGLAQGGTGPCIVVLGADQFDETVASQRVEKQSFFNWFYWSINVGSTVSFAFLSNLAVNGLASIAVSPRMGFFAAYAVATLVFASGSLLFFRGRHRFRAPPPTENVLSIFLSQLLAVCKVSTRGWLVLSGLAAFLPGILLTTASYFVATSSSWHLVLALSGAAAVVYGAVVLITTCSSTMWIDDLNHSHRGVPDVACVLRLLPYMSIIVVFWATYSQMETNFVLQGCQMDLRLGGHSLISPSMLTIVDTAVILLFIPVFDRVVYPQLTSLGVVPTTLRKIGVGLIFLLLAMLSAAWIEVERKRREAVVGVGSNCADEALSARLPMAQMSIVWQAVPYLLIGLSEILTSIAGASER